MKISDLIPKVTDQPNDTTQCRNRGKKEKISFANILQQTSPSTTHETGSVFSAAPMMNASNLTPTQDAAISVGQQALDLLDHCGGLLTDSGFSGDDLETLSQAMSEQSQRLESMRNELDKDDPLRDTIDRIRLLSTVEAMKIHRGDYQGS